MWNLGQLGQPITESWYNLCKIEFGNLKFCKIACGSFHSLLLGTNGIVYGSGDSSFFQLGLHSLCEFTQLQLPEELPYITLISTSYSHTLLYSEKTNKQFYKILNFQILFYINYTNSP